MILHLVAWTGGYEAPSYHLFSNGDLAMGQAKEWAESMEDGDTIDVLVIDTKAMTVERVEVEREEEE